jgi:hypothetical protein
VVAFVSIIDRIHPLKAMSGETKEEEITSSKLSGGAANFGYYSRVVKSASLAICSIARASFSQPLSVAALGKAELALLTPT